MTQKLLQSVKQTLQKQPWLIQEFNGLPLYFLNTGGMSIFGQSNIRSQKFTGSNYRHFTLICRGMRVKFLYDENDLAEVGSGYYKKNRSLRDLRNWISEYTRVYLESIKKSGFFVTEHLKRLSLEELASLASRLSHVLDDSTGLSHAIEAISFVSEAKLKQILDKRDSHTSANIQLLSAPLDESYLSEAQRLLWKIKRAKASQKQKLLRIFLKKFGWIDSTFVEGKLLTEDEVTMLARRQKVPKSASHSKIKQDKNMLIKILHLNNEEQFVVKTIETVAKWQDDRKKYILESIARLEPVIQEIAKRLDFSPESFKYIFPQEISFKNFTSRQFLKELSSRFPHASYFLVQNKETVFSGKESQEIEKSLRKSGRAGIKQLSGLVANKGVAKGKIHVCKSLEDIGKVRRGEILVASMTRPEYLPAMQKAAAIVTDEGGITSHAAIVSRELGIPCIIGTKIATEVFKDGDLVEVNANHGWVRKIS